MFSAEARDIMMKMDMKREEVMMKVLYVSIKHIMVIVSWLKGSPLVWTRENSTCAS